MSRVKHEQVRELARQLIRNSMIEDAMAQFLALTLEHVHDERIKPLQDENERLLAEAAKLSEALRPFADAAMHLHPTTPNEATTLDGIEVGQWRAAYAALADCEAAQ